MIAKELVIANVLTRHGFKSTRLVALTVTCATATGLLAYGHLTGAEWVDLVKWSFGFYAASEVGHKASAALAAKRDPS